MNKYLKIALITSTSIILLYIVFSLFCFYTGFLKLYTNSSNSNEPNLKINTTLYISNFLNPKNGDFISYNFENEMEGKHRRICRLVAQEKDTLEIINGEVFVNNINIDENLNLRHSYIINREDAEKINNEENLFKENLFYVLSPDSVLAFLDKNICEKYNLKSSRQILPKNQLDEIIFDTYKINWNKDNFGPLVIPKDKVFVISDNRDDSEDSRYIGLINKSEINGVLLNN